MNISVEQIQALAPNAAAYKNGQALFASQKFSNYSRSADNTLFFAQCAGSGKTPYECSADYLHPEAPVFRCSCPSRQFPCKHAIGLLHALANQVVFAVAEIPESVSSKREKIEKRLESKTQELASAMSGEKTPKKTNLKALSKKTASQLEGIQMAKEILHSMVLLGLSSLDAKQLDLLQAQIKQLGNYYIPGIQSAFADISIQLEARSNEDYTAVIQQVNFLAALLKKAEMYLTEKNTNPDFVIDIQSPIEEQIGQTWKMTELVELGKFEKDAALIQFTFYTYDDPARKEWVDEGYWLNSKTGAIYKTKNFRPYKANKFIKADDSVMRILHVPLLVIYPGDINPRIRWESAQQEPLTPEALQAFKKHAHSQFADVVKSVKNTIKSPLADKNPLFILQAQSAQRQGEYICLQDAQQESILLSDIAYFTDGTQSHKSLQMFEKLVPSDVRSLQFAVMFEHQLHSSTLVAKPLAIITETKIIRLVY